MNDNERDLISNLQYLNLQNLINVADPVLFCETQPVQQGTLWIVERATVILTFDNAAAGPPSTGDVISLILCPPNSPNIAESANFVGPKANATAAADRPIVIAQADVAALVLNPTVEAEVINLAGAATSSLVTLRSLRKFYVPSQWKVRAVANLTGDVGGIANTTKLNLSLMYAQLDNC